MTKIRIGTRGSPLALYQAHETRDRLMKAHGLAQDDFEIVVITTTGDRIRDRPLAEIGGKGLFTKEIEEALFARDIDLAVHSMKDMPAVLPQGLAFAATLPREDARDALISLSATSLTGMKQGATLGSSSVRRTAQALRLRPDLNVVQFRGNVETRLRKLADGVADASFLAVAGLRRLGLAQHIAAVIPMDEMLPAIAQGAIGIEIRAEDEKTRALLDPINDKPTAVAMACERAFLAALDGSCRTPIAGHAHLAGGTLHFRGETLTLDGKKVFSATRSGTPADAAAMACERAFLAALDGSCRTPIAGHAHLAGGTLHFRGETLTLDGQKVFSATRSGTPADAAAMGADAAAEVKAKGGSLIVGS